MTTGMPEEGATVEKALVHKALVCCGLDVTECLYQHLFRHIHTALSTALQSHAPARERKSIFMCNAKIGLECKADGKFLYHGKNIPEKWVVTDFLITMFIHVSVVNIIHFKRLLTSFSR